MPEFYVKSADGKLVGAQYLRDGGAPLVDTNSAARYVLYEANGVLLANQNTNNYYIVPDQYSLDNARNYAAVLRTLGSAQLDLSTLGSMMNAFRTGGPQDWQRNYTYADGTSGSFYDPVPAFRHSTSFILGIVTGEAKLPLSATEAGGGLLNLLSKGRGNPQIDTSGDYGNNPENIKAIRDGFQYSNGGTNPATFNWDGLYIDRDLGITYASSEGPNGGLIVNVAFTTSEQNQGRSFGVSIDVDELGNPFLISGIESVTSGNLTFDFTTNYYGNGSIVSGGGSASSGYTFNDFMNVDYNIVNGYGTSSLFTPSFYNAYNDWASSLLVNVGNTITYPNLGLGGFYDPIGAFYESTSPANDPAPSIAASTPRLLNASGQGLSEYGISTYDANADGKLSGAELTNLRAWVDANENGTAETGEIKTLTQAGLGEIRQINYIYYTAGNDNLAHRLAV